MTTNAIYDYLKTQNRPYSVNDIISNLYNEHPKAAVQKSLEKLVNSNKIFEKVYGKQKIYCVTQDSTRDADELIRINRELQAHANEVELKCQEVEKLIKEETGKLSKLRESLSLDDALNIRAELKKSVKELTEKLDNLMEGSGSEDLEIEKTNAETVLKEYSSEYNKRKRLCTEIIDCILEGYPGSKKDLHEEIGIEVKLI